ncbi:FHA domain-containing protein [Leptolyngbya sp. AN02str]|uniref:FHA domain-containing protein n=1 Tax=Leptolyngbya sp. AN02str TaxID=3423363 RepID=UPI003D31D6FE
MIVCPNCNHQNPDGAVQCEACYTPLPSMMACPNCGAKVQSDASFCGQCGTNLRAGASPVPEPAAATPTSAPEFAIPDLPLPEPLIAPEPLVVEAQASGIEPGPGFSTSDVPEIPTASSGVPTPAIAPQTAAPNVVPPAVTLPGPQVPPTAPSSTQLQTQSAKLLHVQTNSLIELPQQLSVIHIGKPNDRIPPDVDVSGFPSSEIVSRVHADIRVESDAFYIEDVGSSNGTYINNMPLPKGNRHRLRTGDRIALGKGDKVTFLFQLS